jgi:hypothetical protein
MSGVPISAFRQFLSSGTHTDFVVACQGTEIKVHNLIIAAGSDFFNGVCKAGFKVSGVTHAHRITGPQ